jgi:hypothetical protein
MTVIREVSFGKVCTKWLPKMLTVTHKVPRENMYAKHLQYPEKDGDVFLSRIITDDETWVHHYDSVTKIL